MAWRGVRACFAYLLTVLIILSQIHITAFASGEIEYIGSDASVRTISEAQATSIASDTINWGSGGEQWYVADGTVTINGRVEINGRVHLILKDGSNLTVEGGIHLTGTNSLTIYGQSGGTGHLTARNVKSRKAGIGGNPDESNSSLTINGGNITATGEFGGAGIGGGDGGSGGNITINGGDVTATGGYDGAGIGGGQNGNGGNITVNGGDVTAKGGYGGAGIGSGYLGSGGNTTVSGGIVTATGGDDGAGIGGGYGGSGGTVTVSGGIVTATGGDDGAGIGGGRHGYGGAFGTGTGNSAIIYTNNGIADHSQSNSWNGIIFNGDNGKVYGSSVTPNTDFEIPSGKTLAIENGKELVIDNGRTLTNNGTIRNSGTLTNNGKIIQNGTITGSSPVGDGLTGVLPNITPNPQSQTVKVGDSVSFTVEATNTSAPTYQWQVKMASADWRDIEDAKSNTYRINSVSFAMNGNQYRCKVTNDIGTATSSEAILTVNKKLMSTPRANIDYSAEQLTGLTADAVYKITAAGGAEEEITSSADGKIDIREAWFNKTISIKTKATNSNFADSVSQEIAIPSRHTAPSGLIGTAPTVLGHNDGKITGTTLLMEYKLSGNTSWTTCADGTTSSLVSGTYHVRTKATASAFASESAEIILANGPAPAGVLSITPPSFAEEIYGYAQPGAMSITLSNTGNATATINSVTLDNTSGFDMVSGADNTINPGNSITSYTLQPKEGLNAGTHTANITVAYHSGAGTTTTTAQVLFTVKKATQDAPAQPVLSTKNASSITLQAIVPNTNGAVAQYSKDNGSTYQDSNVFTGLNPSTTYNFVARYKETENYKASEESAVTEITTENAPVSGGGSTSEGGGSSSGGSSNSGSTSGGGGSSSGGSYGSGYINGVVVDSSSGNSGSGTTSGSAGGSTSESSDSPETKSNNDKQNTENMGLLPLEVDANGNVTITKDIILKAIEKAKAEAKNGQEIAAKIAIETGDAPKSVKISIESEALTDLVSSNIHRFVLDTDTFIDLGFNAETLKELKNKISGDAIFSVSKTEVTSSGAKSAIGSRPVYDISILEGKNGQETKIENLNGKTVSISIPYEALKNERSSNLYAVYVDGKGKVRWLIKSSYDKANKAVVFAADHFSVYGVGYKKAVIKFKDITKHRAKEDILFVAGRGILKGTGKTKFSPNGKFTIGMFVTALGRLAQVDPPYANWAAKEGIVSGKDIFSPDKKITKEQMAVIMKNYAKKLGYRLPKTLEEIKFSDNEKISTSAKDAVRQMQMAGIISGKKNNGFEPKGKVTRAEAAAILHRFVKILINQ